jgi:hypothetical protein
MTLDFGGWGELSHHLFIVSPAVSVVDFGFSWEFSLAAMFSVTYYKFNRMSQN